MKTLSSIRRDNMRMLVDRMGGSTKVAAKLGYRNGSFLSQQIGPNPTREITENSARRFERDLGLEVGSLDREASATGSAPAPSDPVGGVTVDVVADVIRMLGAVLAAEGVTLPPQRFADVAALAVTDAAEHGGKGREGHVRSLVRLLK